MLNSKEMQGGLTHEFDSGLRSALFFESPEEMYARIFRELRPRTAAPSVSVEYRRFANAHSSIQLKNGRLSVQISDILEGAPAPVAESLAHILLSKLFRRPVSRTYSHRYRLYLNRKDVRRKTHLVRQIRGRKNLLPPAGERHDLVVVFENLNHQYFGGLMARPELGWSHTRSRTALGHFDPSHNAIAISRIFDSPKVPFVALEYVMFHEMLHLRYPAEHRGARRCVHTAAFREAEKTYPQLAEAKEALKLL